MALLLLDVLFYSEELGERGEGASCERSQAGVLSALAPQRKHICHQDCPHAHSLQAAFRVKRKTVLLYRPTHLQKKPHQLPLLTSTVLHSWRFNEKSSGIREEKK